jgi:hypothetical protein
VWRALRGVFLRRDGGLERGADLLPAGAEFIFAGAAEAVLRQIRSTETDEAQQLRLLVRGWCATRLLQRLRQGDRGDVVTRPGGPAAGKRAVAGEMEVAAASDSINRRQARVAVLIRVIGVGLINFVRLRDGLQGVRTPVRQSGVVEQAKGEFGIVRHGGLRVVARLWAAARPRPRVSGRAGRLDRLIGREGG